MKIYFITGDAEFFKTNKTEKPNHLSDDFSSLPDFPKDKVIIDDFNYHPSKYVDELIETFDYYSKKDKSVVFVSFNNILFDALRVLVKRGKIKHQDVFIYERIGDQWNESIINSDGRLLDYPKTFEVWESFLMELLSFKSE
jgi:hypothetical protein